MVLTNHCIYNMHLFLIWFTISFREKISELFDLGENILCEVWELERHLAGRIDDLISGRDDQDMNDYVLDFSSLNILREVRVFSGHFSLTPHLLIFGERHDC